MNGKEDSFEPKAILYFFEWREAHEQGTCCTTEFKSESYDEKET